MMRPVILSRPAKTAIGRLYLSAAAGTTAKALRATPPRRATSFLVNVRAFSLMSWSPAKSPAGTSPRRCRSRAAKRWQGSGRGPGLVIAAAGLAAPAPQRRALGADRPRRAGRVAEMRYLPGAHLVSLLRRRHVDGLMQPTVPTRRRHRGFRHAVIDDPAALEAEPGIDGAALAAVIGIAEFVMADEFAMDTGIAQRVERRAVPPSEHPQQIQLDRHRGSVQRFFAPPSMASPQAKVQRQRAAQSARDSASSSAATISMPA